MQISEMAKTMARCVGHHIKVVLKSGDVFEGKCKSFTPPFDNEPEIADFDIKRDGFDGLLNITEKEIKLIKIIS